MDATRLAGIADALDLTRKEAHRLHDGRRTQTVTWHQLEDALTLLSASLRRAPVDGEGIAERLSGLAAQAETITDIGRGLAIERDDDIGADMLFWAEAIRRAIGSHRRDLDQPTDAATSL